MFEQNSHTADAESGQIPYTGKNSTGHDTHLQKIVQTIERYAEKLETSRMDRYCVSNRLKLMRMKNRVVSGESLSTIEKELWSMAADIENPSLRIQRNVTIVIIFYTLFTISSYSLLAWTDAILVPSFNIPYSILMMGLLGCLSSMYVILPNFRTRIPANDASTLMFIIKPPIAIIMAGVVFGLFQIALPVIQKLLPFIRINLPDESWFYWVTAWCVGFVNWANLNFDFRLGRKITKPHADANPSKKQVKSANSKAANGLQIDEIIEYVTSNHEGIVIDYNWGDRGMFYNPGNRLPRGIHIMTFKVKDSRNDTVSKLNRQGVYRLNMGISKETFIQMFGRIPARPTVGGTAATGHDYRQLDLITPHPKFGWMAWISVLNPGHTTFETLKPLIEESCKLARQKYEKKAGIAG